MSLENLINYSCNPTLKDYWNNNGLIIIDTRFPNPTSSDGDELKNCSILNVVVLLKPQMNTV